MSQWSDDFEGLVGALQEELPRPEDLERVRAHLETAGVLVTGSALLAARLSEGLSAGSGLAPLAPKTGVLAKLMALSATSKTLVALSLASGVAAPAIWQSMDRGPSSAPESSLGAQTSEPQSRVASAPPQQTAFEKLPLTAQEEIAATSPALSAQGMTSDSASSRPASSRPASSSTASSRANGEAPSGTSKSLDIGTSHGPLPSGASNATTPAPRVDSTAASGVAASLLREETALIEQALVALRGGDRARARAFLSTHAQRFPEGALAPERRQTLERLALTPNP